MSKLLRSPVLAVALVTPIACARLAGIEDPDPLANGSDGGNGNSTPNVGDDKLVISPQNIAITTSCAGGGAPQYVTLENKSSQDVTYELIAPDGSAFTLRDGADASTSSLNGTLAPKGLLLTYVQPIATQAGTFNGALIVRLGDHTMQVPVSVTVTGGGLALSPSLVDFGEVRQNTSSAPQTVVIQNTGTEAVNVIGFGGPNGSSPGPDFAVSLGAGSVNIDPGKTVNATVTMVAGIAGPPISAALEPKTQTPMCGAAPTLTLKGTRVNQDVTVNPVALSYPDTDCSSPGGATRTITVSNFGSTQVTYTATTAASSWFTIDPSSAVVPAAVGSAPGTASITVTLKPVGTTLGDHTDTIDVAIAGPQPKTTTVYASVKSVGAVLDIQPTQLSGFGSQSTKSFTVTNTGNAATYVQHTSSNSAFVIDSKTQQNALFPNLPVKVNVAFVSSGSGSSGSATGQVTTARIPAPPFFGFLNGALCVPPPVVSLRAGN